MKHSIIGIVSGGQWGADYGGLLVAEDLGLAIAGYAPKEWRTERGPNPELGSRFGLEEHAQWDYRGRTEDNVILSDATVIFGVRSPGSNATEEYCRIHQKPCLWIHRTPTNLLPTKNFGEIDIYQFLAMCNDEILLLNVAGNRESRNPGIQADVFKFLKRMLK